MKKDNLRSEPTYDELKAALAELTAQTEEAKAVKELSDDEVRAFFTQYPSAREDAAALAEKLSQCAALTKDALTEAYLALVLTRVKSREELADDDDFLAAYIYSSPRVKAYFREMLSDDGARPVALRGVPSMIGAKKPTTLTDAGEIACKIL